MSERIGIVDADLLISKNHRFPNLAAMKIAAFHKSEGADVRLVTDYNDIPMFDRVFLSKVFTKTNVPDHVLADPKVTYGGTGFFYDKAPPLPPEIEHIMPDYGLYDGFVKEQIASGASKSSLKYYTEFSIGFTSRGCIRGCEFCVNKNCRSCDKHSPVKEFLDPTRKYICLLDDNVLACKDWKRIFRELNESGKRFQFKQGMDERLLTDEKCEVIFSSNWIGEYIFAFDNIRDWDRVVEKLKMIRRYTDKRLTFYTFCGFNHDSPNYYPENFWVIDILQLILRINVLSTYNAFPYVMRYEACYTAPEPYRGMYITLARWCNQPSQFKRKTFREFVESQGKAPARYAEQFEKLHGWVARMFYDRRMI